jgi:hypothetical protein
MLSHSIEIPCRNPHNPPADVGCPHRDKEWHQRAFCEDEQAAGILPPDPPKGPILLGACARAECVYQDWKWVVDELWEHKRHRLQTTACQCLLDECAAHKCQEAARAAQCLLDERAANEHLEKNCCQRLLDERAAYKRREAVRCQRLLDEETARRQRLLDKKAACRERVAHARQMAAAQTIFLWLCCRCLKIRLAQMTARRQQRKAALARLRYEQECCTRAAMADKR